MLWHDDDDDDDDDNDDYDDIDDDDDDYDDDVHLEFYWFIQVGYLFL